MGRHFWEFPTNYIEPSYMYVLTGSPSFTTGTVLPRRPPCTHAVCLWKIMLFGCLSSYSKRPQGQPASLAGVDPWSPLRCPLAFFHAFSSSHLPSHAQNTSANKWPPALLSSGSADKAAAFLVGAIFIRAAIKGKVHFSPQKETGGWNCPENSPFLGTH